MAWRLNRNGGSFGITGILVVGALLTAAQVAPAQTTVNVRVNNGNDDAEQNFSNGSMELDSTDLELAQSPESHDTVGMRFTSIAVPQGANITNAYIQFKVDETSSGAVSLSIRGQAIDDAPGFTTSSNNITSRTKTSASVTVTWSPPAWNSVGAAGVDQRTPNLSGIIQEIVNRSGWSSGNDIVIIITGTGTRTAESYNGDSSGAPLLHIEYIPEPNIYYVRTDGNDGNSGTGSSSGQAWQTVKEATRKDVLLPGDIIYVRAGTYSARIQPDEDGTSGSPIRVVADSSGTVSGWPVGDVILTDSGEKVIELDGDDYWSFEGFKVKGVSGKESVKVKSSAGIQLDSLEIYDGKQGIHVDNAELVVTNCLIRNQVNEGVFIKSTNNYAAFINCTIANNGTAGCSQDNGTFIIYNSIIANNGGKGLDLNGGSMTHGYNLVFGNSGGNYEGTSASTGEISQNPQFTAGYQLSKTSPAVDAGTSLGSPPTDDIRGVLRPTLNAWDMGAYEYIPANADLRGHWKLDETTGMTASDSSGNGNDGELYGTVTFDSDSVSPGARGNALDFDGANDYTQIDDDITLRPNAALSIAAFVKGDTWGGGNEVNVILRKGEGNPNNYQLAIADGQVALYLDDGDGSGIRGDTVLEPNRWYHVAATWDGSFVRIYVNGQLDMTPVARSGTIGTDTRSLYLGGRSGADWFDGTLDDIRLYGRALSQSEVMNAYGLLVHYKFDEAAGATAADSSYHNLDATLQGSSTWTTGRLDGGVLFDGTSDAVTAGTFTPPADGTVLFWMKVPGTPAARGRLFGLHDAWEVRQETTGRLVFDINIGSGEGNLESTVPLATPNKWYHVAATFDSANDEYSVYINGELDTSGSLGLSQQAGGLLSIGTRTGNTEYFDGALDDLRIFDRVLPADEIARIRASALPLGLRIIKWVEVK